MNPNNHEAVTWANDADRRRDMRRRKIGAVKSWLYMKWHGFYWGTLWFLRLGRPYSKMMCRLNLYRKFPDGRCMYCGVNHESN